MGTVALTLLGYLTWNDPKDVGLLISFHVFSED